MSRSQNHQIVLIEISTGVFIHSHFFAFPFHKHRSAVGCEVAPLSNGEQWGLVVSGLPKKFIIGGEKLRGPGINRPFLPISSSFTLSLAPLTLSPSSSLGSMSAQKCRKVTGLEE